MTKNEFIALPADLKAAEAHIAKASSLISFYKERNEERKKEKNTISINILNFPRGKCRKGLK